MISAKIKISFICFICFSCGFYGKAKDNARPSPLIEFNNLLSVAEELKKSNPDSAVVIYQNIIHRCKGLPDKLLNHFHVPKDSIYNVLGSAWYGIGDVWHKRGNLDLALEHYYKALNIFEKTNYYSGLGSVYNNIGLVYLFGQKELDKAQAVFNKARYYFSEAADSINLASVYNNIGNLYKSKSNLSASIAYYDTCIRIHRSINNQHGEAQVLFNLATILYETGRKQEALTNLKLCEKIFSETSEDLLWLGHTYTSLGFIYFQDQKFDAAHHYASKAYTLGNQYKNFDILRRSANLLHKINIQKGRWKEALEYFDVYLGYRDSLQSEEQRSKIIKQQVNYEYEKQRLTDSLRFASQKLEQELIMQAQQEKIQSDASIRNILIALFIILLISIWQIKKRIEIRKQKQAIEISISNINLEQQILRLQLNPKFISKSIDAAEQMIKLEERNLARKYLIGFSKFIRAALEQSKKSNMNLHEEIESLHQFLELESTRLNGNFSFQLDAQNENKHLNAEPIMLQQIFEILIELIECKSKDNPCKMNIRFNGHSHIEFTVEIIASKQIGEWIVQEGLRRYQLLSLAKNIRTRLMKAECIENKLLMSFEPK